MTETVHARNALRRASCRSLSLLAVVLATLVGSSVAEASGSRSGPEPGWTMVSAVPTKGDADGAHEMSQVSCATSSSCVAVDEAGQSHAWRRGKWQRAVDVGSDGSLETISCPTSVFCLAVAASGTSYLYSSSSWHAGAVVDSSQYSYRVSCRSATFCAAVGVNGESDRPNVLATYNGTRWTTTVIKSTGPNDRLLDVSCASRTYCAAVNYDGGVEVFNGSTWRLDAKRGPARLVTVSCGAATSCLALTTSGAAIALHGTAWTAVSPVPGPASFTYAVSCSSGTTCNELSLEGIGARWQRGKWLGTDKIFGATPSALVSVSCPTTSWCLAIDYKGRGATYS